MPEDVVETEIRHIEDNITYLHDKGSRCGIGFTCVVAEEEWIVEPPDYMYLQYTTPFHIAAWCGYFHFFTLLHNQYPSVWSNYISFATLSATTRFTCAFSHAIRGRRTSAKCSLLAR